MIPKIIHYCWFGRNPKPQKVIEYIETWKKFCPGYEIKEWNEENFDVNMMPYTSEAYKMKRFAFVSDVCRMYALAKFGGIYFDTDIEVKRSFDNLLSLPSFLGKEMPFKLSTAVIGAEPHVRWVEAFLSTYESKHFIWSSGKLNTLENTALLTTFFNKNYPKYFDEVTIFEIDYFSAKLYSNNEYNITENTYSVHHFSGSWLKRYSLLNRLQAVSCRYFL